MRTVVEINNLTKKRIDSDFVKKIAQKTAKLSRANLNYLNISVVFVPEAEIRKINRKYRGKNKSTDVLSFQFDLRYNKKGIRGLPAEALAKAGEIILCPEIIAKNARENKNNFSRELAFVLAHGVLHVLGWRHSARMYGLQDKISNF